MNNDMGNALIGTTSQNQPSNSNLSLDPIPIRPRAKPTNRCPTYRRLQTVNALVLGLSGLTIVWYLIDLFVDHFDREESNYLGLGAGGLYFGLGLYACRYSYQMQKKALAEEARTMLEIDDEEQMQSSVAQGNVNMFPAKQSSPASGNKDNKDNKDINISSTSLDMSHV